MKNIENLCVNCFNELTNGNVCEQCGYDNDTVVEITYLQPKTILNGRYVVGALLSHESDAATYVGYDLQLDQQITIREFLPRGVANRLEGNLDVHIRERYRASYDRLKASFINLWSTLIKIRNLSAVVPTYDIFELNSTAYAISDYMDSITLREFLLRNPDGHIDWEKARIMFMPVLTTLEALHGNNIIHGSINPDNLILCRDGKVRLKSFCITEANMMGSELEFNENDGYTALEQYSNNHRMGPATDIYAFSACLFRALVGQNPPNAKSRETNDKLMIPNTIAEKIPTYVIRALGGALQVYPEKRTSYINAFREQLNASPAVVAAAGNNPANSGIVNDPVKSDVNYRGYPEYPDDKKGGNGATIIIIVLVILIAIACGVGYFVAKNDKPQAQATTPVATSEVEKVEVPNFVQAGNTQEEIEKNGVWNNNFTITYDYQYSVDLAEGAVMDQNIAPGEQVDIKTEIIITISKGMKTAEVPDVDGYDLDEATEVLVEAGFSVSTVEIYNDGSHKPKTVKESYGCAPIAGTVIAYGDEVVLQVYGEEQTTSTTESTTQAPVVSIDGETVAVESTEPVSE